MTEHEMKIKMAELANLAVMASGGMDTIAIADFARNAQIVEQYLRDQIAKL